MSAATAATRGRGGSWSWGVKDEEFPLGIHWDAGKVKRERAGLRTLDKKEMGEGFQSPICSLLVGLRKDELEFEIST